MESFQLRRLLFLQHTCLYKFGDGDEMQCNEEFPQIDFKRDSVEDIEIAITRHATKISPERERFMRGGKEYWVKSAPSPMTARAAKGANPSGPTTEAVKPRLELP